MPDQKETENELKAAFISGHVLGRIETKVDTSLAQQSRIEAQQTQILDMSNQLGAEVTKLATDLVDVRDRVSVLERSPGAPHRAQAKSVTTEFRDELQAQHDSMRAIATETKAQTTMLEGVVAAIAAPTPRGASMRGAIFAAGLFVGGTAYALFRAPPAVVVTAPIATSPVVAVPISPPPDAGAPRKEAP